MNIARPTKKDIDMSIRLLGFLESTFEYGYFPDSFEGADDAETFDDCNDTDLRIFVEELRKIFKSRPGGLSRIVWGMGALMDSGAIDMGSDILRIKNGKNS